MPKSCKKRISIFGMVTVHGSSLTPWDLVIEWKVSSLK